MTLKLWIPGSCVPKARPRLARHNIHLPKRYAHWRAVAETEISIQVQGIAGLPLAKATVEIYLMGAHRGDLDNLAGSCLDALVSAGILLDDRLSCVARLVVEHQPDAKNRGVWIVLEEK